MNKKKNAKNQLSDEIILKKMRLASEMSSEELKEYFPALHAELTGQRPSLTVSSREIKQLLNENDESTVKTTESQQVKVGTTQEPEPDIEVPDPLRGFDPGVVDFIRRAKTDEEAIEIIEYMRKRGEISDEKAKMVLDQLKNEGLRSFGSYKQDGYYFHYAQEKKMEYRRRIIEKRKKRQKKIENSSND